MLSLAVQKPIRILLQLDLRESESKALMGLARKVNSSWALVPVMDVIKVLCCCIDHSFITLTKSRHSLGAFHYNITNHYESYI